MAAATICIRCQVDHQAGEGLASCVGGCTRRLPICRTPLLCPSCFAAKNGSLAPPELPTSGPLDELLDVFEMRGWCRDCLLTRAGKCAHHMESTRARNYEWAERRVYVLEAKNYQLELELRHRDAERDLAKTRIDRLLARSGAFEGEGLEGFVSRLLERCRALEERREQQHELQEEFEEG